MNRHEKEKFIAEKNNEINNIFEELTKSKEPHKEFAKAKKKFMEVQTELMKSYVSELEDVINPMNKTVKVPLAAALTLVADLIKQDMSFTDKKMIDVLCFYKCSTIRGGRGGKALKRLINPNRRQKLFLAEHGLKSENWKIEKETPEYLYIVSKNGQHRLLNKN